VASAQILSFLVMQTGRFARACTPNGTLGQGGFGQVYRAIFGNEKSTCGVKIIPAHLRQGETIENHQEVWCGGDVFERLKTHSSPHVLQYFEYWVEERHPFAAVQPRSLFKLESFASLGAFGSFTIDELDDPDGFEWEASDDEATDQFESLDEEPCHRSKFGSGLASNTFLMIRMECCEGISLAEWLYEPAKRNIQALSGEFSMQRALALASQLLEGLASLHDAKIVHRDIKPGNIVLERESGSVRILDFGLARLITDEEDAKFEFKSPHSNKIQAGEGSPGYAAQEQWAGDVAPHPSADIFSAGVVLVELLVAASRGRDNATPWSTAMERAETLQQLRRGAFDQPEVLLGLPTRLHLLILKMINPHPQERPTAAESLREVNAIADSLCTASQA